MHRTPAAADHAINFDNVRRLGGLEWSPSPPLPPTMTAMCTGNLVRCFLLRSMARLSSLAVSANVRNVFDARNASNCPPKYSANAVHTETMWTMACNRRHKMWYRMGKNMFGAAAVCCPHAAKSHTRSHNTNFNLFKSFGSVVVMFIIIFQVPNVWWRRWVPSLCWRIGDKHTIVASFWQLFKSALSTFAYHRR